MKLKTVTLGCKVNQYETEFLREGLLGIGYSDAEEGQSADLCVINTCTVTAQGDAKSRQVIRRMARENPAAKIVVMGCYATRAPEEVARLPNVTEVLTDKRELPDLLGRFGVTDVPTGISGFGRRHRDFRIRLSSIEATEVTKELIEVMARHPDRIAPHLHISMQSGSDSVLRRMRRRWGRQRFIDRCQLLQERLDRPAITTDIIVGFPGETEAEFQETVDTAREVGFSKIHIFPFSARRGTPAASFPGQLSQELKHERVQRLAEVEAELRDRYFHSLAGSRLRVLVESPVEGSPSGQSETFIGTSCRYAPVELVAQHSDEGNFVDVNAGTVRDGRIIAG